MLPDTYEPEEIWLMSEDCRVDVDNKGRDKVLAVER